ncbi:MAG: hypothetical protein ACI4SX_07905 [Candidatus Fimenecus sp.]
MKTNADLEKIRQYISKYREVNAIRQDYAQLQQKHNIEANKAKDIKKIKNTASEYRVSRAALLFLSFVLFDVNSALIVFWLDGKLFANGLIIKEKIVNFVNSADASNATWVIAIVMSAVLLFLLLAPLEALLILKLHAAKKRKEAQRSYDKKLGRANEDNQKVMTTCNGIREQMSLLEYKYEKLAPKMRTDANIVIPESYWFAVDDICTLLANGRADSVKEAINLLEDIWHKNRLENIAAQSAYVYDCNDNSEELDLLRRQVEATEKHTKAVEDLDLHLFLRSLKK